MKPAVAEYRIVYVAIAHACCDLDINFTLLFNGFVIEIPSWFDFLSIVWHVYADFSRDARGAAILLPTRVRLLDYKAETMVSYDPDCAGIRYKSLYRYGASE